MWAASEVGAGSVTPGPGSAAQSPAHRHPTGWGSEAEGRRCRISGWRGFLHRTNAVGKAGGWWEGPEGGRFLFGVRMPWVTHRAHSREGKPRPEREVTLRVPAAPVRVGPRRKSLRRGWTGCGCGGVPGGGRGPRLAPSWGSPGGPVAAKPSNPRAAPPTPAFEDVAHLVSPREPRRLTLGAWSGRAALPDHGWAVCPQAPGQEGGLSRVAVMARLRFRRRPWRREWRVWP
ncbi:hypothetical protein HJG60_007728 [Phyllostomus discolor]|uniref:Uncharacterized protein n=1 Tax=Phyllostomus discolor TaxID=89673 RepID=A0A834ERI2_9CHIR|nr:hypothetical protein HJG60_007728 [Phyllostomus discolor]